MKGSQDILSSILKTTQMGQSSIRCVLKTTMRPALRKALESQLQEYDTIEEEALSLAGSRGWNLPELDPTVQKSAALMTRMRLMRGNTDSRIAGMMIQGNTQGMIKGLKNIHQFNGGDHAVSTISQKLIDCETANIRQMQSFL